jgi:hypothetical protein
LLARHDYTPEKQIEASFMRFCIIAVIIDSGLTLFSIMNHIKQKSIYWKSTLFLSHHCTEQLSSNSHRLSIEPYQIGYQGTIALLYQFSPSIQYQASRTDRPFTLLFTYTSFSSLF